MEHKSCKKLYVSIILIVLLCGCSVFHKDDEHTGNESFYEAVQDSTSVECITEVLQDSTNTTENDNMETELLPLVYNPLVISDSMLNQNFYFWNGMELIRKTAYEYCYTVSEANLLLCQYYRAQRDKFTAIEWNVLSGTSDYAFFDLVDKNDTEGFLEKLTTEGRFVEPAAGEDIEITHFFASLNLLIKNRQSKLLYDKKSMNYAVYDMGTWAGDCLELCVDILQATDESVLESMSDEELRVIAKEHLCAGGHFSRNNMLADIDTFNITASMTEKNMDLLQLIYQYYADTLTTENRFDLFVDTRYGEDAPLEKVYKDTAKVLLSDKNIYIPVLRKKLDLDVNNASHVKLIKAVAYSFAEYILQES